MPPWESDYGGRGEGRRGRGEESDCGGGGREREEGMRTQKLRQDVLSLETLKSCSNIINNSCLLNLWNLLGPGSGLLASPYSPKMSPYMEAKTLVAIVTACTAIRCT